MIHIGIIREGKIPSDSRVVLTPQLCMQAMSDYPVMITVQSSDSRCFADEEYRERGITVQEDISHCDLLLGVKEVPIEQLMEKKSYCFFSHTIKEQPYNRALLKAILSKSIKLIDYEVITDERGARLIAFGYFAGMVGAFNGVLAYLNRLHIDAGLRPLHTYKSYEDSLKDYRRASLPGMRIVLTGSGRVGQGAAKVLEDLGIRRISPEAYLSGEYKEEAVFTQLDCKYYVASADGKSFEKKDFYNHPEHYISIFRPYTAVSDLMINGIYWDKRAPAFFTLEDMRGSDFRIKVIADITCDIAPESSIPSTIRPSTIGEPVYGFNPVTGQETPPYQADCIDVMAIDNLPNELPREASQSFGQQFLAHMLPAFLKEKDPMIERATIAEEGRLGKYFQYLENYVKGKKVK